MATVNIKDFAEPKIVRLVDLSEDSINKIAEAVVQKIVDAEPVKHGHWIERIKVYPDLLVTYNYQCSNCGYWDMHGSNVEVPYCWHCGCKMDEVKDG